MIEYLGECVHCGEVPYLARLSDSRMDKCPKCGERPFRQLIAGRTSFKLLGGGWANDGYEYASHPRFCPKDHKAERGND